MKRLFGSKPSLANVLWHDHTSSASVYFGNPDHALSTLFIGRTAHKQNVHLRIISENPCLAQRIKQGLDHVVNVAGAFVLGVQINGYRQAGVSKACVPGLLEGHQRFNLKSLGLVRQKPTRPLKAPVAVDAGRERQSETKNHEKTFQS